MSIRTDLTRFLITTLSLTRSMFYIRLYFGCVRKENGLVIFNYHRYFLYHLLISGACLTRILDECIQRVVGRRSETRKPSKALDLFCYSCRLYSVLIYHLSSVVSN